MLQCEGDDIEAEFRYGDALGRVPQRFVDLDADANLVECPLEFAADRGGDRFGCDFHRIEHWETGFDGAADEIKRIGENTEETALIAALPAPQHHHRHSHTRTPPY